MTEYHDLPSANALKQERDIVGQAIYLLDNGGQITNMTIGAPPSAGGPPMMASNASVTTTPPTPEPMLTAARAWLWQRQNELDQQLADLGVTNPPAAARRADAA